MISFTRLNPDLHTIPAKKQNSILFLFCVIVLAIFYFFSFSLQTFKKEQIATDVVEYYAFVTAAFECHDLSFTKDCAKGFWARTTEDGRKVNKRTIGMAVMYTPFYEAGQIYTTWQGRPDDGYSRISQSFLVVGMWIYVCIGIFLLGKALYYFFNTRPVITVLLLLVTATNLIWYTNGEVLFTHGVNFMWLSCLLLFTIRYHLKPGYFSMAMIGFSISMMAMIRPNNLLFVLIPLLYNIYDAPSLKQKINLFRNYKHLIVGLILFFLPVIPQVIYWKFATGHWVYYSYQRERFFWTNPHIIDVLFSFRKGWFIYTPIMLLVIPGYFLLKKHVKPMFFVSAITFVIFLYITSCWWAWSYGGCYGMRPMIDIYPLLAFSLASVFSVPKKWLQVLLGVLLAFCIGLNFFQVRQYSYGILHFDGMNYATYKGIWGKTYYPDNYKQLISYPDYERELNGKPAFYSVNELDGEIFSMRYTEGRFVCANDSDQTGLKANHREAAICDAFGFEKVDENSFVIFSENPHLFWSVDSAGYIHSNVKNKADASVFKVENLGGNKFAIRASNNRYISVDKENKSILRANSTVIAKENYVVLRTFIY